MTKEIPINNFLDELAKLAYGTDRQAFMKEGLCVRCSKPAVLFTDLVSQREYKITGFCQKCQDVIFAEPEDK